MLLDVHMPEMDGFQVLEEMQRRGWTESVPTIMISAEMGSAYIDRAFELGASDYISSAVEREAAQRHLAGPGIRMIVEQHRGEPGTRAGIACPSSSRSAR